MKRKIKRELRDICIYSTHPSQDSTYYYKNFPEIKDGFQPKCSVDELRERMFKVTGMEKKISEHAKIYKKIKS